MSNRKLGMILWQVEVSALLALGSFGIYLFVSDGEYIVIFLNAIFQILSGMHNVIFTVLIMVKKQLPSSSCFIGYWGVLLAIKIFTFPAPIMALLMYVDALPSIIYGAVSLIVFVADLVLWCILPIIKPKQVHVKFDDKFQRNSVFRLSTKLTQYEFDEKVKQFYLRLHDNTVRLNSDSVKLQMTRNGVLSQTLPLVTNLDAADWKKKFQITFKGEPGIDYGGPQREWLRLLFDALMSPDQGLFREVIPGCGKYIIDEKSPFLQEDYLRLFNFTGKLMAKAINEKIPVQCHLARYLLLLLSGKTLQSSDLNADDPELFANINKLKNLSSDELDSLDISFSYEMAVSGHVKRKIDLAPDASTKVTTMNVHQYIDSYCSCIMTTAIEEQVTALRDGFNSVIPQSMIVDFSPSEIDLLLCGGDQIDLTEIRGHAMHLNCDAQTDQVQWLWQAVESFSAEDQAKFLSFVTGSDRVPLGGFTYRHGSRPLTIMLSPVLRTDQLPMSHTCFSRLELARYASYDTLKHQLLKAITENDQGFGIV